MKKYLTGIIALVFAIGAFGFSNRGVIMGKETKQGKDICSESSKKWFKMLLDCNGQVSVSDLRNELNYTQSTQAEIGNLCYGTECVCAIWACPKVIMGISRPNIGSNTDIYLNLYNYLIGGQLSGDIVEKDQQGDNSRPAPEE